MSNYLDTTKSGLPLAATPLLAVFDGLTSDEQSAWLAKFAAPTNRVCKYGEKWDAFGLFGKAECGWVDFEKVWLGKFVELGWLEIVEVERFRALGVPGQPESARYEFRSTKSGRDVRDAYWDRLDSRTANSVLSKPSSSK